MNIPQHSDALKEHVKNMGAKTCSTPCVLFSWDIHSCQSLYMKDKTIFESFWVIANLK